MRDHESHVQCQLDLSRIYKRRRRSAEYPSAASSGSHLSYTLSQVAPSLNPEVATALLSWVHNVVGSYGGGSYGGGSYGGGSYGGGVSPHFGHLLRSTVDVPQGDLWWYDEGAPLPQLAAHGSLYRAKVGEK